MSELIHKLVMFSQVLSVTRENFILEHVTKEINKVYQQIMELKKLEVTSGRGKPDGDSGSGANVSAKCKHGFYPGSAGAYCSCVPTLWPKQGAGGAGDKPEQCQHVYSELDGLCLECESPRDEHCFECNKILGDNRSVLCQSCSKKDSCEEPKPPTPPTQDSWEVEISRKLYEEWIDYGAHGILGIDEDKLKSHVRSLLSQAQEQLQNANKGLAKELEFCRSTTLAKIKEGLKHIAMYDNGNNPKYAVEDVLNLLDH